MSPLCSTLYRKDEAMAKKHELPALALRKYAKGKYCDGGGLWLVKTDQV